MVKRIPFDQIDNSLLFNGKNAYNHLNYLTKKIGHRNSGSFNERKAAEYIAGEFNKIGLETYFQDFNVETSSVINQTIQVLEPYNEIIECRALPLAGQTGPEGVTGELIYLESISEEYVSSIINGKIVLTSGYYRKGIELLKENKPLAIINIGRAGSHGVSHGWGTLALSKKFGFTPTVNISYEDGRKLLLNEVSKVKVIVETRENSGTSQNVVGEITGTEKPDEIIIIGGHYDTVPDVPGASDNGGGTVIMMELARVFSEKGTKRTMRFIAWGCEEIGLKGSEYDLKKMKKENDEQKKSDPKALTEFDKIKLVVNIDVQGAMIGSNTVNNLGPPELGASVKLLAKEIGVVFNQPRSGGGIQNGVYSSDGTTYASAGIPALQFVRSGAKAIHNLLDNIDYISPEGLRVQGAFIEKLLTRYVADSHSFPFEKKIPEDVQKSIKKYYENRMSKPPTE